MLILNLYILCVSGQTSVIVARISTEESIKIEKLVLSVVSRSCLCLFLVIVLVSCTCLLQLPPLVFISGKETSMKIYGLNTVIAVGVI